MKLRGTNGVGGLVGFGGAYLLGILPVPLWMRIPGWVFFAVLIILDVWLHRAVSPSEICNPEPAKRGELSPMTFFTILAIFGSVISMVWVTQEAWRGYLGREGQKVIAQITELERDFTSYGFSRYYVVADYSPPGEASNHRIRMRIPSTTYERLKEGQSVEVAYSKWKVAPAAIISIEGLEYPEWCGWLLFLGIGVVSWCKTKSFLFRSLASEKK